MIKYQILLVIILFSFKVSPLIGGILNEKDTVKIACVGNSITYGSGISDREHNAYPAQLQNMLGEGFEVKNFGVSGRTLLKNGDLPYTNTNQYLQALEYNADIVLIKLGTNDSKSQNRKYLSEFVDDYKSMITSFRNKNKDARIVLLLPLPSFITDTAGIWNPVILQQIIPKVQQVAFDLDVEVIDMYQLFINQPNYLMPDNIHPSSLGATLMAKRIYETIQLDSSSYDLFERLRIKESEMINFYGFEQVNFSLNENQYKIVSPKRVLVDKPWVWRARFFGHQPQTDIALLERGFHLVYCDVSKLYGNKEAVEKWNVCYQTMVNAGLNTKPVLEGMSRGGLIIYNWASENLDKVSCIYADAPVLDPKSWPGGFGDGVGSAKDWLSLKQKYRIDNESLLKRFTGWPIHKAKLFASANIPLLHVCGEADNVVPVAENTQLFAEDIRNNGGEITTIYKADVGHHPHSLKNPAVIVDFILRATDHKINFAAMPIPGSEYRSAAGWQSGKGWWQQAAQIDSICQVTDEVDLLLIGNSITQGWGGPRDWVTYKPGQNAANKYFEGLKWIGAGISGDRTQHVIWRLKKGQYNRCNPKFVGIAIGVNNFGHNNVSEIIDGLRLVLSTAQNEFGDATIMFFGPLPTGLNENSEQRVKYKKIHQELAKFNYAPNVYYYNLEELFSDENGALKNNFYVGDGIHLKGDGYEVLAEFISNEMNKLSKIKEPLEH